MTQEEKQLLLIDLCARLPHGVKVKNVKNNFDITTFNHNAEEIKFLIEKYDIKPYLRTMSSMTEEERLELSMLTNDKFKFYLYTRKPEIICYEKYSYLEGLKVLDWLNSHHFDYRGLIEKGLALEAPADMYTKN